MKLLKSFIAFLGFGVASCSNAQTVNWPELPKTGFISGRAATVDDAKSDNAVFSMDGKSLGPIQIAIPQYVFWKDDKGVEHPMFLVQAERAPTGMEIVGLRAFDGTATAATMPEVRLLGVEKPSQ